MTEKILFPSRELASIAAAFPSSWSLMRRGVVVLARRRKGVADDRLKDEAVRSRREAVAGAEFNVYVFHLEIGDRVQCWLCCCSGKILPTLP